MSVSQHKKRNLTVASKSGLSGTHGVQIVDLGLKLIPRPLNAPLDPDAKFNLPTFKMPVLWAQNLKIVDATVKCMLNELEIPNLEHFRIFLDEQQEKHFIILLDEMAEQDLIKRPLPDVIVPKDDGLYKIMKRLERKFFII